MSVHAVVVNYRTAEDLAEFCESFYDAPPSRECLLTVVNVSPTERDREVAACFPDKAYLETPNHGYGRACNLAAATAEPADVYMFFNADVVLTPGAIDQLAADLAADAQAGVVGPCQVDDQGRFTAAGIFGTRERPRHRGFHERDRGQYRDVQPSVTVAGSAIAVDAACWDELVACDLNPVGMRGLRGAFLETPHYYEETWLCYHAQQHGWGVWYDGTVTVTHKWHRASPRTGKDSAERHFKNSQRMFRAACDTHGIPRD